MHNGENAFEVLLYLYKQCKHHTKYVFSVYKLIHFGNVIYVWKYWSSIYIEMSITQNSLKKIPLKFDQHPLKIKTVVTMLVHDGVGSDSEQYALEEISATQPQDMHQACQSVADTTLDTATEIIRGVYGDLMDDAGVIDITDSYDGSWQKRGFTSHHGVGVAIEVQTGLVIDDEALSCHVPYQRSVWARALRLFRPEKHL